MSVSSFPYGVIKAAPAGEVVEFSAASYVASAFRISPLDATAVLTISTDGNVYRSINGGGAVSIGTWIQGGGAPASPGDYDIMAETTGGNGLDIGTADTWQSMASTRSYGCIATGTFDFDNFLGIFRIRPSGGGADLDSATCNINATTEA